MKTQTIKQAFKATFTGDANKNQLLIVFIIIASIVLPLMFIFGHPDKY